MLNMKYVDRVYGEFEINEPVVLEIIQSKYLQRLKKLIKLVINRFGLNQKWKLMNMTIADLLIR